MYESTQADSATKLNEPQVYVLKKIAENADFDYSKLDSLDNFSIDSLGVKNLMPVFEPTNGNYSYYQFISTFEGEAYVVDEETSEENRIRVFHEILIIKTDDEKKIIDAYQYTLEWAELPLQYDLFKSSEQNVYLTNTMDISQLKFKRTYGGSEEHIELNDGGTIQLN